MASLSPLLLSSSSTNLRRVRRSHVCASASCNPNSNNPLQKKRAEDGEGSIVSEEGSEKRVNMMKRGGSSAVQITAEKAKMMRREMRLTETWHDAMYHSAIASRLASPDDDQ